ncbi:hypothetical protein [Paraburkholderia elongata]|uniref:Uncharacterized protein n=1 Tax=Paraburkholderia elongata TaxID=2675747 RepID=A0A972SKG4_9BURK|nr:hypothetical protein [Paraburkholderia elongata]NPT58032.1 hypothetical protein [Paraburkholderia elongata]
MRLIMILDFPIDEPALYASYASSIADAAGSPLIVADDCTVLRGVKKLEYQVFDNGLP